MRAATLLLANAAEVRDGLLYVLGGGLHHLWVAELPTEVAPTIVVAVDLDPAEAHRPFAAHLRVTTSTGDVVVDAPIPPALPAAAANGSSDLVRVPIVFRAVLHLRDAGVHHVVVEVDGAELASTDVIVEVAGR